MYAYMLLILILRASLYAYTHFWFSGIPIDYLGSIHDEHLVKNTGPAVWFRTTWKRTKNIYFFSALKIVVPLVCTKNMYAQVTDDAAEKGKCQPQSTTCSRRYTPAPQWLWWSKYYHRTRKGLTMLLQLVRREEKSDIAGWSDFTVERVSFSTQLNPTQLVVSLCS